MFARQNDLFRSTDNTLPTRSRSLRLFVAAAALLGLITLPLLAEDQKLPTGEQVLENAIKAAGGREAHNKLHSTVARGSFEVVNMGIKFSLVAYSAEPHFSYVELDSESMGKIRAGSNGQVAWEITTTQGPSIAEGDALAFKLREGTFNSELVWKKFFEKVECVGIEEVGDRSCYKVVLTPFQGKPITRFYDRETSLVVKTDFVMATPMGEIDISATASDYREVDGVKVPFRIEQSMMGMTQAQIVESVEFNVEIPAERFALPEEIQAILAKEDPKNGAGTNPPTGNAVE